MIFEMPFDCKAGEFLSIDSSGQIERVFRALPPTLQVPHIQTTVFPPSHFVEQHPQPQYQEPRHRRRDGYSRRPPELVMATRNKVIELIQGREDGLSEAKVARLIFPSPTIQQNRYVDKEIWNLAIAGKVVRSFRGDEKWVTWKKPEAMVAP